MEYYMYHLKVIHLIRVEISCVHEDVKLSRLGMSVGLKSVELELESIDPRTNL